MAPLRRPPKRYGSLEDIYMQLNLAAASPSLEVQLPDLIDVEGGPTVDEALSGPEQHLWQQAMDEEIDSLMSNSTWSLVDLPPGRRPITCKWVLKKKYKSDGSIDRYKARLVARGFSQSAGFDYAETFSPVLGNVGDAPAQMAANEEVTHVEKDVPATSMEGSSTGKRKRTRSRMSDTIMETSKRLADSLNNAAEERAERFKIADSASAEGFTLAETGRDRRNELNHGTATINTLQIACALRDIGTAIHTLSASFANKRNA